MKSMYIKSGKIEAVLNDLKDCLNGTLTSNSGEHRLALNSAIANGKIAVVTFPQGMIFVQLELTFWTDVSLSMEQLKNAPLLFIYCSKGSFKHSLGTLGSKTLLKKEQSAILKSTSTINNILYFEKNVPIQLTVIGIASSENGAFANDMLSRKLKHSFLDMEENIMNVESQDLKIVQKIKSLDALKQNDSNRSVLKKQIVQSILEREMEQKTDSFTTLSNRIADFTLKQMDEMKRVSSYIMNFRVEELLKFRI